MFNTIFNKIKKNKKKDIISSKKKDIKLASVNKANEEQLEFVLSENETIDHIYATKGIDQYEMSFTQSGRSIYLRLMLPDKLLLDSNKKLDIYFIINRVYFRPYLEIADTIPSSSRHFDITPGLKASAYIYFSKKYKRAMLQIKQIKNIEFEDIVIEDNQISLLANKENNLYFNYTMVLERWGKYISLQTDWQSEKITGLISKAVANELAIGFGYSVRLINSNDENVPINVEAKNFGKVQVAKNDKNEILPFKWEKIPLIKKYGESYVQYPENINIVAMYLEYKERQVYRKIEFKSSDDWMKLDINFDEVWNLFKGIHTIYQKDNTKILRSYNELQEVEKISYLPNILNVIVTSTKEQIQLHLENSVVIVSVSLREKQNKLWNKYKINETVNVIKLDMSIVNIDFLVIEYFDNNSNVQKSISKLDDVYVEVGR